MRDTKSRTPAGGRAAAGGTSGGGKTPGGKASAGKSGSSGRASTGGGRRGSRSVEAPKVRVPRAAAAADGARTPRGDKPSRAGNASTTGAGARPPKPKAPSKGPAPAKTPERLRGIAGLGSGGTVAFPAVHYLGSLDSATGLPGTIPEFALIGRSNVGKSSLLNALCGSRKLARTGRTPGRTQRIHLFEVRSHEGVELRLCDLPGYGHAAAGAKVAAGFGPMIESFLLGRPMLRRVLLLFDARRTPDEDTLGFLAWLREQGVAFEVVITKVDKLSHTGRGATLATLQQALELSSPPVATSVTDGSGVEALRDRLCAWASSTRAGRRR